VAHQFTTLSFPEPEGGVISVVYPIVFTNEPVETGLLSMRAPMSTPRSPSRFGLGAITSRAAKDDDLGPPPARWNIGPSWPIGMRRSDLQAQTATLFFLRRFQEAYAQTRRWADFDLDSAEAQRMLAYAAALVGETTEHAFALDAAVDASPDSFVLRMD